MRMKRVMAAVLGGTIVAASFTGCASSTETTAAQTEETAAQSSADAAESQTAEEAQAEAGGEKVKMTLILRGGSYAAVLKEALPDFEASHNCEIEVLEMSFDDLHTGIALDAVNPTGTYDLCMVDGSWMAEFTENGVLANLSEMGYSFDDDIIPNTTDICKVGEDIYLAPYFGNVTVMLYNKANVEAAGYKPEDITTLETMLEAAKAAQASGTNGFAYRGDTGDNIVSDFLPILLAFGGWVVDENNQPTVTSQEFVDAMNYYVELIGTGAAMSKDDVTAAVDNGNATLAIGWPGWYVPTADGSANYTVIPTKLNDSDTEKNTALYGIWTIGIPNNSQNKELAMELLEYVMSPEVQKESIAAGGVPCRESCLLDPEILAEYPHLETVCGALQSGVYQHPRHRNGLHHSGFQDD